MSQHLAAGSLLKIISLFILLSSLSRADDLTRMSGFGKATFVDIENINRALERASSKRESWKSCRTHPLLAGRCFTLHARLSVYNGAPALRLWKIGTRRMLGVSEQRFAVAGYRNIPESIESQINQDVAIFGDFLVCPFTRPHPGEMQLVCIEEGKNLVVRKPRHKPEM